MHANSRVTAAPVAALYWPQSQVRRRNSHDGGDRRSRFEAQYYGRPAGLLRQGRQVPHGAALGGAQGPGHAGAEDAVRAGDLEIRRRQAADAGGGRGDHRGGSRAPRAGAGEPGRDRQVAHHQFAVRRHPAHLAGRGRRRASARRLRHPLRAGRRGRLYRGRGREDADEARRLHHHRQLGAARSRQSRQAAGDVARRARPADGQSFRNVVCRAFRREDAENQSRATATRSTATPPACCRTARRSA